MDKLITIKQIEAQVKKVNNAAKTMDIAYREFRNGNVFASYLRAVESAMLEYQKEKLALSNLKHLYSNQK